MTALAKLPIRMSVDEFLAWAPDSPERWQLVDGVPCAMAPPGVLKGVLQIELGALLRDHLRKTGAACRVVGTPGVVPKFLSDHNMRVPDLAVTCSPFGSGTRSITDPVLIAEILSPSNEADTWNNVWAYTSIPSLLDILVLRTDRMAASLLRRAPGAAWPDRPEEIADGPISLASINLTLAIQDIYTGTGL